MDSLRVLVTGAGSGVGQGIMKALRAATLPTRVIGADISPFNAGLFRAEEAVLIPRVETAGALDAMCSVIHAAKVDAVLIGSEFDLRFFSENKAAIESATGAVVVVSPPHVVTIAEDKALTAAFLRDHGLPHASFLVPNDLEAALEGALSLGYPLLLKPRRGTSARHVHVVSNSAALHRLFSSVPEPMLQRMISMPGPKLAKEYTCSIFKCRDGSLIGPFTARRTLRGGNSWVIEVQAFEQLHPLLLAIGECLDGLGSINIQLMIGENGPTPFEFNARFSGTTAVRAHFQFNEPELALRHFVLGEKLVQPTIREGLALRYLEEVFVDDASAETAQDHFSKGIVRPWF